MDALVQFLQQEAGLPKAAARPDWAAETAAGRAQQPARDATAQAVRTAEGGIDPVASQPTQDQWSQRIGGEPAPAANDPLSNYLRKEVAELNRRSIPDDVVQPEPQAETPTAFGKYVKGPAEAALSIATGIPAAVAGNVAGIAKGVFGGKYGTPEGANEAARYAHEVTQSLTYAPRSEEGRSALQGVGDVVSATKLQGLGPAEAMSLGSVMAGTPRGPLRVPTKAAAGEAAAPSVAQGASVGAAGTNLASQAEALVANASPELQGIVAKVKDKLTPQALRTVERHVEADTLPVPVRLTKGQATQDASLLSNERNLRGKDESLVQRFNEQNSQLVENTNRIREKAAPDLYVTSKPELGETIIKGYLDKDATLSSAVSAKYKALRDANGGQFPLDGVAFVDAADKALHKALVFDFVPAPLRATMERLRDGGNMTFEQFEAMRTNLARIQRSPTMDGNVKHAAGIIRESLENMPMSAEGAALKPLADAARSAARERFALIESDPAYKAIMREKASADKFIDKFVLGADKKHVETMRRNLEHDAGAQQAMASGAVRRLQDKAGIRDEGTSGQFSQAGFNRELDAMRPKLSILFQPEVVRDLENLGKVSRYVKEYPAGSFVNTSNTFTAAVANQAANIAEATVNRVAGLGSPWFPLGSIMRDAAGKRTQTKAINDMLQTGAGLTVRDLKEGKGR